MVKHTAIKMYVGHGWMKILAATSEASPDELSDVTLVLTCAGPGHPWLDEQGREWTLVDGRCQLAVPGVAEGGGSGS